ncbi:hypothetical protein [Paenibacillus sp. FSL H7-0323]|uniref:hypothetical protein n=1 Tax=Paenibacillus sp. FSL H7-0323 TaxID=2921433 RepID=UPI0030F8E0F9
MSLTTFSLSISPDAWIQTFGGFFGALLAGGIAIYLFKRQVNHEFRRTRIKELHNFLKSYYVLNDWIVWFLITADSITEMMEDDNNTIQYRIELLPYQLESLNSYMFQLNQINDDYIPQEIYKAYLEVKSIIAIFKKQCEVDLNIYQQGRMSPTKEIYRLQVKLLNRHKEEIDQYAKGKEEELKKLTNKEK